MPSKSHNGRQHRGLRNALSLAALTLFISVFFTGPAQSTLSRVDFAVGILILVLIIVVAVIADILAIAATAADEAPFHAMATDRVPGGKEAVSIVRHSDRVNSICADVVGDISGTVSGAIGAGIVYDIKALFPDASVPLLSMVTLGLIAALTVGGKASTKGLAVRNANIIVGAVGKGWYWVKRISPRAKKAGA